MGKTAEPLSGFDCTSESRTSLCVWRFGYLSCVVCSMICIVNRIRFGLNTKQHDRSPTILLRVGRGRHSSPVERLRGLRVAFIRLPLGQDAPLKVTLVVGIVHFALSEFRRLRHLSVVALSRRLRPASVDQKRKGKQLGQPTVALPVRRQGLQGTGLRSQS